MDWITHSDIETFRLWEYLNYKNIEVSLRRATETLSKLYVVNAGIFDDLFSFGDFPDV